MVLLFCLRYDGVDNLGYITERASALFIIMAIVIWRKKIIGCKRQWEFPGNSRDYFGKSWRFLARLHSRWSASRWTLICDCPFPSGCDYQKTLFLFSSPDGSVFSGGCRMGMGQSESISWHSLGPGASHFPSLLVQNKSLSSRRNKPLITPHVLPSDTDFMYVKKQNQQKASQFIFSCPDFLRD